MWETIGDVSGRVLASLAAANDVHDEGKSRGAPFADAPRQYCHQPREGGHAGGNGKGTGRLQGVDCPRPAQRNGFLLLR